MIYCLKSLFLIFLNVQKCIIFSIIYLKYTIFSLIFKVHKNMEYFFLLIFKSSCLSFFTILCGTLISLIFGTQPQTNQIYYTRAR